MCQEWWGWKRGIEIINCVNCVAFLEKVTPEQRLKGGEAVSHVDIRRKKVSGKCQS